MTSIRNPRLILTNMIILLVVTLVTISVSELLVRMLYKDKIVLFPRYHTDAQYGDFTLRKIRPNSKFWHKSVDGSWRFVTNNQGFRNYEDFAYEKPSDKIRILSLGDSHTQGYEVRQGYTFSAVIEKYLQRHGGKADVINAGVSGFSTAEELIFLQEEGKKYQPDVVLLGFFRNDFQDNVKSGLFKLDEDGHLLVAKKQHIPGVRIQNLIYEVPGVKWMSEHSYLYSLAFNSTWAFFKKRLAHKSEDRLLEYAIATEETFSDYQIALAAKLITRMYEVCRMMDARFIIIDIPGRNNEDPLLSSIPPSLAQTVLQASDAYIDTTSELSEYRGLAELHVPHGHMHISEFTHIMIGIAVSKKIRSFLENKLGLGVTGLPRPG